MSESPEWLGFYAPHFPSLPEAQVFVDACEAQAPPNNSAKIIMHQGARLVSLADDITKIRPRRESLQIFLLIVCAEAISKLDRNAPEGLGSRRAVRRFFGEFVPGELRSCLASGFRRNSGEALRLDDVVDILYEVRCDVAHKGEYWGIALHDGTMPMLNVDPDVTAYITIETIRDIVVQGCVNAAVRNLSDGSDEAA